MKQQTIDPSRYPVSIAQECLLREHICVPPAVGLQAVADVLLLLHVHIVELTDGHRISRARSAWRQRARGTLRWTLTRALGWVHMNCVRTKKHVWLAGPDLSGAFLDEVADL